MKETSLAHWRIWLRDPIARALLLSACLHLALLALVQPVPGPGKPRTVVISARLEIPAPESSPAMAGMPALPATGPDQNSSPSASAPLATEQPAPVQLPQTPPPPATVETRPSPAASPTVGSPPNVGQIPLSSLPALPLGIDTTWYLARQVDVHPRAIGRIDPAYPEEARRRNQEGTLKLMLKIDELGRVKEAEVVEAQPPGMFDEAALAAFRNARFQPAMKDGRPVRYQAYMRVDFKLED
jgi:protein TonB